MPTKQTDQDVTSLPADTASDALPVVSPSRSEHYPGVPRAVVGWTTFFLDLGGPALVMMLGLVATAIAVVTGQPTPAAVAGATALGGCAATVNTRRRRPPLIRAADDPPG
jgi:hypothetical protein